MQRIPCKYCGKMVVWSLDVIGNNIPLDATAKVYAPRGIPAQKGVVQVMVLGHDEAMVSHLSICKKMEQRR